MFSPLLPLISTSLLHAALTARLPPSLSCRSTAVRLGSQVADPTLALAQWLDLCGAERNGIEIGYVNGVRGLVASKPIARGVLSTQMLKVPVALAIGDSNEEFRDTVFGQAVPASEWLRLQPDARLALRLLNERDRGCASPWHDYIRLLPASVPTGRHLSTAVEQIADAALREQVLSAAAYVPSLHAMLVELSERVGGGAYNSTEAELGWALDMVFSRSFTVDAGARGLRRFMVPFVDMLNHDQQHGCQFSYEDDSDCFIVEWLGEVDPPRPGEQIYLDYGDKDGNELLLMYGFVPTQPTEHDYWLLDGAYCKEDWEAAPGDEAMLHEKRAMLTSCRYDSPRKFELRMNRVDPAVVNALRVLGLSEVDLGQSCEGSWTRALAHAPVSVANERWVAASLRARSERELCRCESSLEDDLAALEQSSDSITNVLQLRDNNKVLINSVIEKLDNFLKPEAAPDERMPNLLEEMPDYMPNVYGWDVASL